MFPDQGHTKSQSIPENITQISHKLYLLSALILDFTLELVSSSNEALQGLILSFVFFCPHVLDHASLKSTSPVEKLAKQTQM